MRTTSQEAVVLANTAIIVLILSVCCYVHSTLALPTSTGIASPCGEHTNRISQYVRSGRLSLARSAAVEAVAANPECEKSIASAYVEASDALLHRDRNDGNYSYLSLVNSIARDQSSNTDLDPTPCWGGGGEHFDWDACCSAFRKTETCSSGAIFLVAQASADNLNGQGAGGIVACADPSSGLPVCCDFFAGSSSHLRLPALREVALNVRVSMPSSTDAIIVQNVTLSLEQDGFLRPFDVSSILWPAGYLLTLCVASPLQCGAIELSRAIDSAIDIRGQRSNAFAIELGAGIGAPSIAMSLFIERALSLRRAKDHDGAAGIESSQPPLVVATDAALHSLALSAANARTNHASVEVLRADYTNLSALSDIEKGSGGGFAVVLGSSLQAFFDGTHDPNASLWSALDILLDPNIPEAVAVLSHTRSEPVRPPRDGRYRLCRRITGDVFGMKTRSGDTSDFAVSLFQREESSGRYVYDSKQGPVLAGVEL